MIKRVAGPTVDTCPECNAPVANVQGVEVCPDCAWDGRGRDRAHADTR